MRTLDCLPKKFVITIYKPCDVISKCSLDFRLTSFSRLTAPCRTIRTSSVMSKEQIEELQKNPFFDKYASKIAKLQQ